MDDAKNNVEGKNFYFHVSTRCKDGSYEYTDNFLVETSDSTLASGKNEEEFDRTILEWNYNHCEWNDHLKSYWDGERLISVRTKQAMTYDDYVVVNGYLPSIDIDGFILDGDLIEEFGGHGDERI